MFIEVKRDVIERAAKGDVLALHVLKMVCIGIQRGKHWYFLPKIRPTDFKTLLTPGDLALLNKCSDNDSNALSNLVEVKLIVTCDDNYALKQGELLYNPCRHNSFELFEETHLICENLYDVDFYKIFVKYFLKYHPKRNCLRSCRNKMLERNGGGRTTAKVVERELKKEEHLLLVILDRDSKCPGYPIGDTAKDVESIFRNTEAPFASHYILQHHREAENLIPYPVLKKLGAHSVTLGMLDHCNMQWFDFKEGIRINDLYGDNIYNHWAGEINKIKDINPELVKFDITLRDSIKEPGQSVKEYVEKCKLHANPTFIHGLGKNVLSDATVEMSSSHSYTPERADLTAEQHQEWQTIGSLIWHWTLSKESRI